MNNRAEKSFKVVWPLMISQTIGAFNDNVMKAMLPVMAAVQFGKASMDTVNQQVSILLILPFVVFAPFAGWVADRFSKKKVIVFSLFGQLLGLGLLAGALYAENLQYSLAGFFLLSVQSAFLSPAKKGILKELVGTSRLGKAVGFMEMLAMVGILGGAFVGAIAFDHLVEERGGWVAALIICGFVTVFALASWVIAWPIPETQVIRGKAFHRSLFVRHFHDLFYLFKHRGLRYAALGDAWFWGVGSFFYLVLVKLSGEVVVGKIGMGSLYGYWFLLVGVGIMLGSLFVAYLNRGRIEIGLTPIGALAIPVIYFALYFAEPMTLSFDCCCFFLGFFGALFFVPLNGYLQDQAKEEERGKILAASNLLTQLCGIGLILFHAYLSNVLKLSAKEEILVIMAPALVIGILTVSKLLEDFCRAWFHLLLKIFYRIRIVGMEQFPQGGCLIVSNHLSYADPVFIGAAFPRKVRYLAYSGLASSRIMRFVFRLTETLTVSPEKSLDSIKKSVRKLKAGVPLCVFAEGGISKLGTILPFMRGSILLAKQAKVPIVPVHLDHVWGSVFSMHRGKFFSKKPLSFPYCVTVRVGEPMQPEEESVQVVWNEVMELARKSFNQRLKKEEHALRFLKNRMLAHPEASFFQSIDGRVWKKSDFIQFLEDPMRESPPEFSGWLKQVRDLFAGDYQAAERIYAGWLRVNEMNLWDQPGLYIGEGEGPWQEHWFPWFPLLGNRVIRPFKNGMVMGKDLSNLEKSSLPATVGLASFHNGLISVNGPNVFHAWASPPEFNHSGSKKNTLGRLMVGYSYFQSKEGFFLRGVGEAEQLHRVQSVDEEGFLVEL